MYNNAEIKTVDSVVTTILLSRKVKDIIFSFTEKLDKEGTLELFINGEKLDKLMAEFRKKGILSGNYAWIDFSSEYLVRDFNAELIHCFAEVFFANRAFTEDDMEGVLNQVIPTLKSPEGAHQLFFWLFNYASKVSNVFIQALEYYYAGHPKEEINYMPYVTAAIPGVVKAKPNCTLWAISKKRTLCKVYWGCMFQELPFETCYNAMFKGVAATPSGYSKDQVHSEVYHLFRLLMIDEVFTKITKNKERTARNISDEITQIYWHRKTFVYALFVKAFLWVLMDDAARAQAMNNIANHDIAIPESYNNGFGNLPS